MHSTEHEFVNKEIIRINSTSMKIDEYIETYLMNIQIFKESLFLIMNNMIEQV